jgi:hypothetical protein
MEVIMAEDRKPGDPTANRGQDEPKPGFDPVDPANDPAVERDPAASGGTRKTTVVTDSGRSGIIIAGVIAVIAIIAAIIAMNWDWADPQATQMPADPAAIEEGAPATGDDVTPAPADEGVAPEGDAVEPAPVE